MLATHFDFSLFFPYLLKRCYTFLLFLVIIKFIKFQEIIIDRLEDLVIIISYILIGCFLLSDFQFINCTPLIYSDRSTNFYF